MKYAKHWSISDPSFLNDIINVFTFAVQRRYQFECGGCQKWNDFTAEESRTQICKHCKEANKLT